MIKQILLLENATLPNYMNYYFNAAKKSRNNSEQWFRYLRKFITSEGCKLSDNEINYMLLSDHLTMYQKITLKRALINGTETNKKVISLNEKTKTPMLDHIKRKNKYV